jgi:hypothetical protein
MPLRCDKIAARHCVKHLKHLSSAAAACSHHTSSTRTVDRFWTIIRAVVLIDGR